MQRQSWFRCLSRTLSLLAALAVSLPARASTLNFQGWQVAIGKDGSYRHCAIVNDAMAPSHSGNLYTTAMGLTLQPTKRKNVFRLGVRDTFAQIGVSHPIKIGIRFDSDTPVFFGSKHIRYQQFWRRTSKLYTIFLPRSMLMHFLVSLVNSSELSIIFVGRKHTRILRVPTDTRLRFAQKAARQFTECLRGGPFWEPRSWRN